MTPDFSSRPFLLVHGLTKTYRRGHWPQQNGHKALDGVNLMLHCGRTLALIGASGCGKTTMAMCMAGLQRPDSGEIWVDNCNLAAAQDWQRDNARVEVQIVFQDSVDALNPLLSVTEIVEEPLAVHCSMRKMQRERRVRELMLQAGLTPELKSRRPDQLSGGQRQRVVIARSLALRPRLLILDEPFRGLDLSTRGQIINLLIELQVANNLGYLYISHDLDVVQHFADEVAVMHEGRIVEWGLTSQVLRKPIHPAAKTLVDASNSIVNEANDLRGEVTCATS
jgi:ABC-type glutathione transport system ATPase component